MNEIRSQLEKKCQHLDDFEQIWSIHDYLTDKREEIDEKYDYRYSRLMIVFAKLLGQEFIKEEDLKGFSEDKLEALRSISG